MPQNSTYLVFFCRLQSYAKGDSRIAYSCTPDDPEAKIFCDAHLHENRAFPGPYTADEIFATIHRKCGFSIAHKAKDRSRRLVGVCEDFEPVEGYAEQQRQKETEEWRTQTFASWKQAQAQLEDLRQKLSKVGEPWILPTCYNPEK